MSRVKYPRTFHVPWSPGATSDDKVHGDVASMFEEHCVVVTEKMDGENTTIYSDGYCHARSMDSAHHPSRSWVKANIAPRMVGNLPPGWRVCGENMYAKHSLFYDRLPSYFLVFSIWDTDNTCLSWEDTEIWCKLLGLETVPVLYKGFWDEDKIRGLWTGKSAYGEEGEGYTIRRCSKFSSREFKNSLAKYVRENHVTTNTHWMSHKVVENKLCLRREKD